MKKTRVSLLCLCGSFAFAQVFAEPAAPAKVVIELRTGEKIEGSKISKIAPDGITLWTDGGPKKIAVSKMAKSEQEKYGLDEEKAAAHVAARDREEAAYHAQQDAAASANASVAAAKQEAAEQKEQKPKYLTAEYVKAVWMRQIAPPRSLESDYGAKQAEYQSFIADIRNGVRDLEARDTAANYNKAKAVSVGDQAMADNYEAELSRIQEEKKMAQSERESRRRHQEAAWLKREFDQVDLWLRTL